MGGFNVQCIVKESNLGGLGLYADEYITKGTAIWTAYNNNILKITRPQYYQLCNSELDKSIMSLKLYNAISVYSLYDIDSDCLVMILDNNRYVNHSNEPNSLYIDGVSIALRDIEVGEEIVEDYGSYDHFPWPEPMDNYPLGHDLNIRIEYMKTHPENPCQETFLDRYKCYTQQTDDRGVGLFLGVDCKEGDVFWEMTDENVVLISEEQWKIFIESQLEGSALSTGFYEAIAYYSFYMASYNSMVLCVDNARFINHSKDGTIVDLDGVYNVFGRDYSAGIEIVDDYSKYDKCDWVNFAWAHVLEP